ncbi:putative uncharacterized protein MYH16 isoform X2 [Callorhinchus milii]|nr:putative uncharacterized protein MYH16 isoform X2 [Callorhinchus milii]XP_042199491.1 putative uncharacterized protein MYH16 isoform X2 [Callorhinchus milii]
MMQRNVLQLAQNSPSPEWIELFHGDSVVLTLPSEAHSQTQSVWAIRHNWNTMTFSEKMELEDILKRLQEDGVDTDVCTADENLQHLWRIYHRSEGMLQATVKDLERVQQQQATEMKEVENYVTHIRNLSEEREAVTGEFEQENEVLKVELQQLQQEQDTQLKEVEEMLGQEGLADIAHSGPSEQIAYLLVERATLLEKLEIAERKVDSQSLAGSLRETHLQEELEQMQQTLEEELRQQRESMQRTKEAMAQEPLSQPPSPWKKLFGVHQQALRVSTDAATHKEDVERELRLRELAERDLEEAAQRLQMAHEEIRHLTDKLDMEKKMLEQNDPALQAARREIEVLKEEVAELRERDVNDIDKAKEQNNKLDKEILALRDRVRLLDAERKSLLKVVENLQKSLGVAKPAEMEQSPFYQKSSDLRMHHSTNQELWDDSRKEEVHASPQMTPVPATRKKKKPLSGACIGPKDYTACTSSPETDGNGTDPPPECPRSKAEELHKRCHQEVSRLDTKNHELMQRFHKVQEELEEVTERNEALEGALEDIRNQMKEEKAAFENEKESLKKKIATMESDHMKLKRKYKDLKAKSHNVIGALGKEQDVREQMKSNEATCAELQQKYEEEKKRRDYLEATLVTTQQGKTRNEEELEAYRTQVHYLNTELKEARNITQHTNAMNTTVEKLQHDKCILEKKVCKLEEELRKARKELKSCNWKEKAEGYSHQLADQQNSLYKMEEVRTTAEQEINKLRFQMSEACSKVEGSQNKLTCVVKENQQLLQENGALRQQICSLQQECKLLTQENTDLRQKFCNYQVETSHLHQDNASFRQQLVCSQQENQRLNQELCNIQKQLGGQMLCKEDNNNQMELQSLRKKVARLQCALEFEQQKACQERLALEMQLEEANNRTKSQECLLTQDTGEARQLRQDLQRIHNLCSAAEKELKYKREQLVDVQKHNALLSQEATRVGVDLKAIQDKICAQERENKALRCEIEEKQEKIKGLELEAAKSCQLSKQLKCLHDELASEKCRVQAAEKKFAEMQQHLNSCQHQVRLAETRIKEKEIMEAELNDKRDLVCMLRNELQEELLQRKLAEQCADDLHHQLKTMQDKETCQARMVADLQHCLHEQQARVRALEEEKTSISNENECQQRVRKQQTEELLATQQELEKHKEELRSVLQQLDSHVRLHNDKQIKHKMKLRKAKEIFIREVMARDGKVKQLENEVKLMRNLLDKEHTWNMKITCENDLLLAEKRDLLQKLNEQEELVRNNSSIACGVKQRINYLEDENKQLQDETVTLSSRLGSLERTLKNIQSIRALEDLKRTLSNENLLSKCLPSSLASDFPGGSGTDSVLDCIRRVKLNEPADCMKFSYLGSSRVPYSDIGYLNVSGSSAGVRFREQEDRHSLCSDEV